MWPFDRDFPWSVVATAAAFLGSVVWLGARRRAPIRGTAIALLVLGGATCNGDYLAIHVPQAFTHPWLGPYVSLVAGTVAVVSAAVAAQRSRRVS